MSPRSASHLHVHEIQEELNATLLKVMEKVVGDLKDLERRTLQGFSHYKAQARKDPWQCAAREENSQ